MKEVKRYTIVFYVGDTKHRWIRFGENIYSVLDKTKEAIKREFPNKYVHGTCISKNW